MLLAPAISLIMKSFSNFIRKNILSKGVNSLTTYPSMNFHHPDYKCVLFIMILIPTTSLDVRGFSNFG